MKIQQTEKEDKYTITANILAMFGTWKTIHSPTKGVTTTWGSPLISYCSHNFPIDIDSRGTIETLIDKLYEMFKGHKALQNVPKTELMLLMSGKHFKLHEKLQDYKEYIEDDHLYLIISSKGRFIKHFSTLEKVISDSKITTDTSSSSDSLDVTDVTDVTVVIDNNIFESTAFKDMNVYLGSNINSENFWQEILRVLERIIEINYVPEITEKARLYLYHIYSDMIAKLEASIIQNNDNIEEQKYLINCKRHCVLKIIKFVHDSKDKAFLFRCKQLIFSQLTNVGCYNNPQGCNEIETNNSRITDNLLYAFKSFSFKSDICSNLLSYLEKDDEVKLLSKPAQAMDIACDSRRV